MITNIRNHCPAKAAMSKPDRQIRHAKTRAGFYTGLAHSFRAVTMAGALGLSGGVMLSGGAYAVDHIRRDMQSDIHASVAESLAPSAGALHLMEAGGLSVVFGLGSAFGGALALDAASRRRRKWQGQAQSLQAIDGVADIRRLLSPAKQP